MGFSRKKRVELPPKCADEGKFLKLMRRLHEGEEVDDKVTLIALALCSRPLSSLASGSSSFGEIKKHSFGAMLRHDYLKLTVGEQETYLFEKLAETQCGVFYGTKVNVTEYGEVENEKVRLMIDLKGLKLPANDLYAVLIEGGKVYHPFTLNCWHYGHEKAKEIIDLLLQKDLGITEADKEELMRAIDNVVTKERPNVVDCFRLIYNPWSSQNEKTWEKIENRCEGKWWARCPGKILRKSHNVLFNHGSSSQGRTSPVASEGSG